MPATRNNSPIVRAQTSSMTIPPKTNGANAYPETPEKIGSVPDSPIVTAPLIPPASPDDSSQSPSEAENKLAMEMMLLSEMSERVEHRPPRITRSTLFPEIDQIPDPNGELRFKVDQWANKAAFLLTNLFLHEAAVEACSMESRFELARRPGMEDLQEMFAKIKAYELPTLVNVKPREGQDQDKK